MKLIIALAIVIGLAVGIGFAVLQNSRTSSNGTDSSTTASNEEIDPRKNLPVEVLKALPPEELAEIYPEKAEAILNPESVNQIQKGGKSSDDPEYLRAILLKMGANPPADATTSELQDMLANASEETTISGK
jgi:hypothetical protein